MKAILGEVLREFYEFGIPEDVKPRAVDHLEKKISPVFRGIPRNDKSHPYMLTNRTVSLISSDSGQRVDDLLDIIPNLTCNCC